MKPKQLDYKDYLKGTKQILEDSKLEKEKYNVKVLSKNFIVHPNVFSPKYFNDTELFAKNIPINKNEEMLEIGPGTGIISIEAINKGAKNIIAVDINPDAVQNTKENIKLHDMEDRIEVRQGNLYEPIEKNEKFDTIFWNTPFGLVEEVNLPDLEKAVYDPGYKSTEAFIKEAPKYLKENGKLLIGFSSTLGKMNLLQKFAREAGFELKLVYAEESEEVHPVKFEIFEAKQNHSKGGS